MDQPVNPPVEPTVVAAFDFDGTLSTRDNVVPFLRRIAGTGAVGKSLAGSAVHLGRRPRDEWTRDQVKIELVRRLLTGRDAGDVATIAERFARDVHARHLRPEAVERVEWHRGQGHRLVIVSASFAVYLRPIAQQLGFDAVLATELETGDDDRLTGRLKGPNVRGAEKARLLDKWLDERLDGERSFVWAYGDSAGDRELWARADRAVRLGRRARRGTQ